jgi:hypothetical protein
MKETQTTHCNELYQRHLKLLKLQGKAQKTIYGDIYFTL